MQIFFQTRQAARNSKLNGKTVDNGKEANKRWGKEVAKLADVAKGLFVEQDVRLAKQHKKPVKVVTAAIRKSCKGMMIQQGV